MLGELRAGLEIDSRIRTTAHRFIAEGECVVVEARGNDLTKAGMRYDNDYCFVFRLADGKLREPTEYFAPS